MKIRLCVYVILNKAPIYDFYNVRFVDQESFNSLNVCEDKWLNKLNAPTEIQTMILSQVK